MYKMKILQLLIIYLYLVINACAHYIGQPVIWNRIPQFEIKSRVVSFLRNNDIVNCFEFEESIEHLYLKCLSDNKLFNVEININKKRRSNSVYI